MRLTLLFALVLSSSIWAEEIDRISSSQQIADHHVFVSATGAGPWILQVGVSPSPQVKSMSYSDLEVAVFDVHGNKLLVSPKRPGGSGWIEISGSGRQACGIYSVEKFSGGDPARAELKFHGKQAVFELKDRSANSKSP